jgi:hypothetical protein
MQNSSEITRKLDNLVSAVRARPKKAPKIKDIEFWSDAISLYRPNSLSPVAPTSTDIKIYTAILEKINRETDISAREFVYWYIQNFDNGIFGNDIFTMNIFNKNYKKYLEIYIKNRRLEQLNNNNKRKLPSLNVFRPRKD